MSLTLYSSFVDVPAIKNRMFTNKYPFMILPSFCIASLKDGGVIEVGVVLKLLQSMPDKKSDLSKENFQVAIFVSFPCNDKNQIHKASFGDFSWLTCCLKRKHNSRCFNGAHIQPNNVFSIFVFFYCCWSRMMHFQSLWRAKKSISILLISERDMVSNVTCQVLQY